MDFPMELSWQARWTVALLLLDSACRKSLRLDVVCLNVALSACAKGGRWRVAVQLMQRWEMEMGWGEGEKMVDLMGFESFECNFMVIYRDFRAIHRVFTV